LPGILLLTGAAFVVIAALLVSGLRLALPHLDSWRPAILGKIESATGLPVSASQLSASWQNFGPTLEARNIHAQLKDGGEFSVNASRWRWMSGKVCCTCVGSFAISPFGNCSCAPILLSSVVKAEMELKPTISAISSCVSLIISISRDSHISFITLSGQRAELAIPQLTWLNGKIGIAPRVRSASPA
jgi:uncharacterized protein YhdP